MMYDLAPKGIKTGVDSLPYVRSEINLDTERS